MPLDFPSSPANGQVYEQYVYDSALPGWRSKGGAVAATYVSDTAPSGAVKGDMWYRSSDGTTYVYVVDVDTSQWVEIRSEISTSKVGLAPVVPSSVTVGSGSASTSATGTVTFSGATSISLQGVFSSSFTNYRILFRQSASGGGSSDSAFRFLTTGATADSTANYFDEVSYTLNNGTGTGFYHFSATQGWLTAGGLARGHVTMDVFSPFAASFSAATWQGSVYNGSNMYSFYGNVEHIGTTSMSGIQFYPTSGNTISGTFQVYGYN